MPASDDERDDLAGVHPRDQLARARAFVVLVQADQRPSSDAVALEQHARVARVLAGDHVGLARAPSSTRSVTSCRLPIGVGQTSSRPAATSAGVMRANIGSTRCRPSPTRRRGTRATARGHACCPAARAPRARPSRARAALRTRAAARRGERETAHAARRPRRALSRLLAAADGQTRRARGARADRRVDRAVAAAVPDQLALRAHVAAGERRRRARPGRLPADVGEQHPRARLRPAPEGQQGTGREHVRARAARTRSC